MDFDFSDEQRLLRDQARKFLADRAAPAAVRRILEDDQAAYDRELWHGMVAMGWTGTVIPEEFGGAGLGHVELCVLAEELGRSLAPTPFSSSVYLATEAILLAGSDDQRHRYLPPLATGDAIGTFALAEGAKAATPGNIRTRVEAGRIDGVKLPVADGDIADFAVVAAVDGGPGGGPGGGLGGGHGGAISLFLVDLAGDGVQRRTVKTVDPTRSHARLAFDGAAAEPLGPAGAGSDLIRRLFDRAAVMVAFEQVGGAEAALHMARSYAMDRFAFGRPIASFQALKHRMADMYIAIELARSNAYYGAWALSTGAAELPIAAATARVSAIDAFHLASKENIQIHGGMGFTWEFDCHMYYRRAKLLALSLGSARQWKDRLISQLEARNAA